MKTKIKNFKRDLLKMALNGTKTVTHLQIALACTFPIAIFFSSAWFCIVNNYYTNPIQNTVPLKVWTVKLFYLA